MIPHPLPQAQTRGPGDDDAEERHKLIVEMGDCVDTSAVSSVSHSVSCCAILRAIVGIRQESEFNVAANDGFPRVQSGVG
jgi:hypothetical protein